MLKWQLPVYVSPVFALIGAQKALKNLPSSVRLYYIECQVMKMCTKFERNRIIRGGVIAISLYAFWGRGVRYPGFDRKWIFTFPASEVCKCTNVSGSFNAIGQCGAEYWWFNQFSLPCFQGHFKMCWEIRHGFCYKFHGKCHSKGSEYANQHL